MARFNFTNITLSSKANIQDVMNNFNKIENLGITSTEVDTKINTAKTTVTSETDTKLNNKVNKAGDTMTGTLTVPTLKAGAASGSRVEMSNGAVEIYHNTPFIDFHFNNDVSDSTSRVIEESKGTLTFKNNVKVNGTLTGTLTGNASSASSCSGNAATATKLKTARTIGITGGATGTATSFDGSGNINIPVTSLDATKLSGTASINTSGNAGSATKLQTARNINGVSFNGTGNITIKADPTVHEITGTSNLNTFVTPGFYYGAGSNSITNKPSGADAFGMIVIKDAGSRIVQFMVVTGGTTASDKNFYFRETTDNGSTWGSWYNFYTSLHKPSKSDVGLGNVDNKSSATIRGEITLSNVTTALGFAPAPQNHASTATTYGVGTSSNYGHTKIINNLTTSSYSDGQALSAYQGYQLNQGKAPNNHASSATTYGVGTGSNYGHCKVINNLTTASASDGLALNAYQGKVLNDKITTVNNSLKPLAKVNYSYGTAAPSGGSNGDIYDQYF